MFDPFKLYLCQEGGFQALCEYNTMRDLITQDNALIDMVQRYEKCAIYSDESFPITEMEYYSYFDADDKWHDFCWISKVAIHDTLQSCEDCGEYTMNIYECHVQDWQDNFDSENGHYQTPIDVIKRKCVQCK